MSRQAMRTISRRLSVRNASISPASSLLVSMAAAVLLG